MITGSYRDNDLLKLVTDFYLLQINRPDIIELFDIYFTDNILEDIKMFNKGKTTTILPSGITILPISKRNKITVLISEDVAQEVQIQYILHELCHVYDFVRFADKFCRGKIFRIRKHKYEATLRYWSEFHVQLYIMPYANTLYTLLGNNQYDYVESFKNNIGLFYYDAYNKKLLNKTDVTILDIMYYLGEITMCNQVDSDVCYSIPNEIVEKYPFIIELNDVMVKYLSFEAFCMNYKSLHKLLYG